MVSLLDLFEGRLSYSEIEEMPLDRLYSLVDAKIKQIQKKIAERQKEMTNLENKKTK